MVLTLYLTDVLTQVVVVDNHFAAIGGLDLCFGRWDTPNHPLADVHPTHFGLTLFPGQDYNNARIMDFKEVKNYVSNTLSILESARMPWHDVYLSVYICTINFETDNVGSYDYDWTGSAGHSTALHRALE